MKENLEVTEFNLKRIIENLDSIPSNGKIDQPKKLSAQDKKKLMQLVSNFNEYGKVLRCEHALVETARTLNQIAQMAETYALTESSDFFQGRVVERDFKQVKGITKDFAKISQECFGKIQQLNALYEDMGHVLGRYYEIQSLDEIAAQAGAPMESAPAPQSGEQVPPAQPTDFSQLSEGDVEEEDVDDKEKSKFPWSKK
jgi:hypothetical protein